MNGDCEYACIARLYASALARVLSPSDASATTRRTRRGGCASRRGAAPACAAAALDLGHGRTRRPAMQSVVSEAALSMG